MLLTLAIANYRSLRDLVIPLERLTLITGPNGAGKSSVYRSLRLLAQTALVGVPAWWLPRTRGDGLLLDSGVKRVQRAVRLDVTV